MGVRKTSALLGRLGGRGAVKVAEEGGRRLYSVAEPLHCMYYKLRRWRDEAAIVRGLIRFMVAFYGPDETTEILGSLLADKGYQQAFRRAQEGFDSDIGAIPAGDAAATYRALVKHHRGLCDSDRQVAVAGELLDIGAKLGKSREAERSIEYNDELIGRFESTSIHEVQVAVAKAYFNKAVAMQGAGKHKAAVTAFNKVATRFGPSASPSIQECVATALLNRGFLHGHLGEPDAAIACYDEVARRFGGSPQPQVRLCVAMALRNKGSTLAGPESSKAMHSAIGVWDDVIERFDGDGEPDIQVQVATALTKKAGARMKMGDNEAAVAACDEVVRRYRTSDQPDLQREVAMALELKGMSLNRMGRGREALETCDDLVRNFGGMAGRRGIPVRWRAMGCRIHGLVLEGKESAAAELFRTMCDDLDVADREMVGKVVWDTIDLMAAGATPEVFAGALARSAEDCQEFVPLLAALQKLAGRRVRVPEEFERVAGDIVEMIQERSRWVGSVRATWKEAEARRLTTP